MRCLFTTRRRVLVERVFVQYIWSVFKTACKINAALKKQCLDQMVVRERERERERAIERERERERERECVSEGVRVIFIQRFWKRARKVGVANFQWGSIIFRSRSVFPVQMFVVFNLTISNQVVFLSNINKYWLYLLITFFYGFTIFTLTYLNHCFNWMDFNFFHYLNYSM